MMPIQELPLGKQPFISHSRVKSKEQHEYMSPELTSSPTFANFRHTRRHAGAKILTVLVVFLIAVHLVLILRDSSPLNILRMSTSPHFAQSSQTNVTGPSVGETIIIVQNSSSCTESDLLEPSPPMVLREKMNATFVTLARNSDVWEIAGSIRQVEDRFNKDYHYDWVFLSDKPFTDEFKRVTTNMVSGQTHYGEIPSKHWSYPSWIDQEKARKTREEMGQKQIIYGDSISYRHMCRFESGFFFQQELMLNYEWYWRVEPNVRFFCDLPYDPFRELAESNKKYGFVLSLYEYIETIPTLWESVKKFMRTFPQHIHPNNSMSFISDDNGTTYNKCHFWSNFEIGNLNWLRSPAYKEFFDFLDKEGGFFYERWGDAPVHSIAASLLLDKSEVHFFNDIAYWHNPFTHCPTDPQIKQSLRCTCDPAQNFDWKAYSCTSRWFATNNLTRPVGWEKEV